MKKGVVFLGRGAGFWKKVIVPGVLLVLVALLAAGCGGKPPAGKTEGQSAPKEKIIRITEANVPNIDPGVGSDYSSSIALCNLYDTLVFPNDDGTVSPMLATRWETSPDGLTWTFELRQGVKFHNGEELTAEDVAFSMQRIIAMGEGYGYLFAKVVKEAVPVDKYKVQFKLNKPFGPFLATLVRLYVLDKSQVLANIKKPGQYGEMGDYGKEWLLTNDAGSGPYTVKELKKQEYLYAVKFPGYWGGWENKDAPDAFKIIGTTAASTVRTMMTRRELEISDQWQSEEALKALAGIPGVAVNASFSGTTLNLMMNTKKPPTDDVHFRKALAYAFDYKTAAEKIFPASKPARGPVSHILPGFNENAFQYTFDLEKAKEELAKSKYAGSLDQYPVELAWMAEVPDEEKIALLFQTEAAKLGIKVNVVKVPWLSFIEQVAKKETTPNISTIFVSPHYNEAGSILETRYHSKSVGTWEQCEWLMDKDIDAAIEDALATMDTAQRMAKYKGIQEKVIELCPTIWVLDQAEKRAYQKDYIYWPAAELTKAGKPVSPVMGYNFYFRNFKVFPEKMPQAQ